jgi:putative SOS response-associated peptidase YedK
VIGQNFLVYCKASEFEVIYSEFSVCYAQEHHDACLSGEAGKEVLVPYPMDRMKAWPVSPRMNSPKNNDPEIIVPIEPEPVARQANSLQLL